MVVLMLSRIWNKIYLGKPTFICAKANVQHKAIMLGVFSDTFWMVKEHTQKCFFLCKVNDENLSRSHPKLICVSWHCYVPPSCYRRLFWQKKLTNNKGRSDWFLYKITIYMSEIVKGREGVGRERRERLHAKHPFILNYFIETQRIQWLPNSNYKLIGIHLQ